MDLIKFKLKIFIDIHLFTLFVLNQELYLKFWCIIHDKLYINKINN